MASLGRRLRHLERRAFPDHADCIWTDRDAMDDYIERLERRGWPLMDQCDFVASCWIIHSWGGSQQEATDRELSLLNALIENGELSETARERFRRMEPAQQPEREAWLFAHRESLRESSDGAIARYQASRERRREREE